MDKTIETAEIHEKIRSAATLIRGSRYLAAFTGAGISVESGIPPFRDAGGLWNRYDPRMLELDYLLAPPPKSHGLQTRSLVLFNTSETSSVGSGSIFRARHLPSNKPRSFSQSNFSPTPKRQDAPSKPRKPPPR